MYYRLTLEDLYRPNVVDFRISMPEHARLGLGEKHVSYIAKKSFSDDEVIVALVQRYSLSSRL